MRKTVLYISLILTLGCLSAKTRGQSVRKETMAQVKDAVILYSDGIFPGVVWGLGQSLYDDKTGATIRHGVTAGNGNNLNANAKLLHRILIAPTDVSNLRQVGHPSMMSWSGAMGFSAENNSNMGATCSGDLQKSGCASYIPPVTTDDAFIGYVSLTARWRLPTQRELQLMWLLHDAIDQAFLPDYPKREKLSGTYWSSTEEDATTAWYFDFNPFFPGCSKAPKTTPYKVRCVRDY